MLTNKEQLYQNFDNRSSSKNLNPKISRGVQFDAPPPPPPLEASRVNYFLSIIHTYRTNLLQQNNLNVTKESVDFGTETTVDIKIVAINQSMFIKQHQQATCVTSVWNFIPSRFLSINILQLSFPNSFHRRGFSVLETRPLKCSAVGI